MVFNSLDELFNTITSIRERVYAVAEQVPSELGGTRPSPDAWSAAETLDHMGLAEEFVVSQIKQQLALPEADIKANIAARFPGAPDSAEKGRRFQPFSMEKIGAITRGRKLTAPPPLVPHPDSTIHQALERLRRTRADLLSLRPQIEALDLSEKRFPHFVFGELTIYEWIALTGMHDNRHLDQIVATLSQLQRSKAD